VESLYEAYRDRMSLMGRAVRPYNMLSRVEQDVWECVGDRALEIVERLAPGAGLHIPRF
jgi:hypothetical protein